MYPGSRYIEFAKEETDQSVGIRFEKQVMKNGSRLAVKTSSQQITYDQLNKTANQLARTIRQWSRDEKPVAILLEHDLPAIVAIFAVLKAAKIFLLVDPALPDTRISHLLNDAGASLIVTNNQTSSVAQEFVSSSRTIVNMDGIDPFLAADDLCIAIAADAISYILYTSGSTGQPKGVIQTHRNDLQNIRHHTNSLFISDADRITLLGSYSTGQGMQDIYCALLNGGTLYPWSMKAFGLNGLADWLIQEGITVYNSAATVFRHFVRNLCGDEQFPDLRVVRLGSEPVSWKDVELFKKHFPRNCVFVNALSCSEVKTFRQLIINKEVQMTGVVPVGYPVEDKEVLLLDETGRNLGPNAIGEIAVRSRYLSPGYWQKPDFTRSAFEPDPQNPDVRIYRTGDLGRISPDGCLQHLGRKDTQVKIRGFRIETYEVELALLQNPAVDQAFVISRDHGNGDNYLVAYIVLGAGLPFSLKELKVFIRERLPEYMLPSAIVVLEALPLTSTGKIDRSALPKPQVTRPMLEPFVPPTGPLQQEIANIWGEVIGLDKIGIDDNLFELGGNSLSAMQIVARIEKSWQVRVPLKRFLEVPTIRSLSDIIKDVGELEVPRTMPFARVSRGENIPLSFGQQRLWFLDQWEPSSANYTICRAYHLRGQLDVAALEQSLKDTVRRHEILRTRFPTIDGHPIQAVSDESMVTLSVTDLRNLPEKERSRRAWEIIRAELQQPFNLASGPLLRLSLVQHSKDEHFFVLVVHQIVCDGSSLQIFLHELCVLYDGRNKRRLNSLPALPLQYADFAVWQRRWLQGEQLEFHLSYWKGQLGDSLPVLSFPTDRPRSAIIGKRGARQSLRLPRFLTAALKKLSRDEGVTIFMTLLAAFDILLFRYTGEEDLLVGFPIANRTSADTAGLMGFFVNTLVLRTVLTGVSTIRELLSRIRDVCVAAYAHQDLPFEKLVEELHPRRDLTRNPLFQTMFLFQIEESTQIDLSGIKSRVLELDSGTSKVDLTLSLADHGDDLTGFFEYSTNLFDQSTIERMIGHFQNILEGVVVNPDQRVSDLSLLTEAERNQLLSEWNNTKTNYPAQKCVHQLFEAQVEQTPDAVAVVHDEEQLSYRELNKQANQLAHYLSGLGVGADTLVGIFLERSLAMVVALVGVLKAGGACVPFDPDLPRERLAFMLQDVSTSILLIESKHLESACNLSSTARLVCLDRDWGEIAQQDASNALSGVRSENLAYVMYTSGSTGQPKGVQVAHRSIVNCLYSIGQRVGFCDKDVFLSVTKISSDIAALELYLPLSTGARVVLASSDDVLDGKQLADKLETSAATMMQATPSTWKLLIDTGWRPRETFKILCGGEALSRRLADLLLDGGASLWNLYGPTETTIWSNLIRIEAGDGPVLIGRPVANTEICILDAYLQPVPVGVHGELYIGGDGLARGYLNQPELTAEKFIPNPFSDQAGSRLYRTGDLARYRPDGNIEFLGRTDHQVKIRGHRVELGEVEFALNQHPAVKESVVISSSFSSPRQVRAKVGVLPSANSQREGVPLSLPSSFEEEEVSESDHKLTAYLTVNAQKPLASELRSFLSQKLPEYMIPWAFVVLEALPLTRNGKIDRSKLPLPDAARAEINQEIVEPRSEIEELVAQIWRELLKCEPIGVYDNFFDLGGHSLLATRVVARLRSNFQVDFPLRTLFELPTIAGLAEYIHRLRCSSAGTSIAPIAPVNRDQPLPLSFSQRRLWYLQKVDPNLSAYNIPAAFRIRGDLNHAALEQALNDVIARHEMLRSCIREIDGQPCQQVEPALHIDLAVIDLTHLPGKQAGEARRLCEAEAYRLYDLGKPPLFRAALVKLTSDEHVLMLNFHHIVADGSSLTIFYRELGQFYDAACVGNTATLPLLPIQYGDFAAWQQEWLRSDAFHVQLEYWKSQLAELPPSIDLPTDFARPISAARPGARLTRQLSEASTTALKAFSRQHGATVFMTLFATFDVLLSRITGQEDITVGSTLAGRNRPEIEGLIGFFINALPLRIDLSGDPTFLVLLQRVREVCLDAYAHQEMPFEKIVEELRPLREPAHNPIFDILFNIADISERVLALIGCDIAWFGSSPQQAKFDLVLHAPEVNGRIELAVVYNTELFKEERIVLLLEQWATALDQAVTVPELPISRLSLLTESSCTVLPDPTQKLDDIWQGTIHEILGEQARRSPSSVAVIDPQDNWTYGEIDQAANRLSNALINAGIQPRDTVAIYAERNASLVIAIFSILKAGAAFLILDPAYPQARAIQYLRAAQPKGWLQLSQIGEYDELTSYLDTLDLHCRMKTPHAKGELLQSLVSFSNSAPDIRVGADDPAYIAFTSGSTGEPKGVVCRHGPITHFLPWQKEALEIIENDRFALLSGLAYSHLHRDVFTCIDVGATIFIPSPTEARSPDQLANWLERNAITVLHLTPALGQLLATGTKTLLPAMRRVFFGGDVLTMLDVARIGELTPNAVIGSFYGTTETQRAVGYYEITEDPNYSSSRTVPLGKGIRDVQLLVLNRSGKLAGVGELGGIFVRSPHLAEGYLGDHNRTQEMFITNPFTQNPQDRLYRTGEVGRYLPDGNVDGAGRNDRRINIRGFRVELEEIESILKQHHSVKDAAVVLQEFRDTESEASTPLLDEPQKIPIGNNEASENPKSKIQNHKSSNRLIAYIVSTDENSQTLSDLLYAYLSARLPDYMVPAHFVMLSSLRLSPNGKIDYRALPPIQFSAAAMSVAPRNEIELKLQAIFAEVLERSDIGIDDNFFRLGGHSLLAARAAARIGDAFSGLGLMLSDFLAAPTVKDLAEKVASSAGQINTESDKDHREEFDL